MNEFLDLRLFNISDKTVTVATTLVVLGIFVGGFISARLIRRVLARAFARRGLKEEGTLTTVQRLANYLLFFVTFGVALDTLGVDLAAFFAAGALFAVGIGFAMQNITQNFVSGVILLVERAIKAGDIIELDGSLVRVVDLGMRATAVRTLNDEDMIVPNSNIVQSTVKNLTLRDRMHRIRVEVGVVYGSNMSTVVEVLREAARSMQWRKESKEPVILWRGFGASSVDFEVSVWIDTPWERQTRKSQLFETIWFALKEAEVTIAFPQLDVHFDSGVNTAIEQALPTIAALPGQQKDARSTTPPEHASVHGPDSSGAQT